MLANLIRSADTDDLVHLVQTFQIDLISTLCYNITKIIDNKNQGQLVHEILDAIVSLINIEKAYKNNTAGYKSIVEMIEICDGIDTISDL